MAGVPNEIDGGGYATATSRLEIGQVGYELFVATLVSKFVSPFSERGGVVGADAGIGDILTCRTLWFSSTDRVIISDKVGELASPKRTEVQVCGIRRTISEAILVKGAFIKSNVISSALTSIPLGLIDGHFRLRVTGLFQREGVRRR